MFGASWQTSLSRRPLKGLTTLCDVQLLQWHGMHVHVTRTEVLTPHLTHVL
jgi:hypothetical protein